MGRPFGSSERVSKSDPFSSNNRLSISRTFPGTPPNNHTLPFPDVLAQTPKFNYPLIRLRSASPAHSLLNRPKMVFPPNKHPQHPKDKGRKRKERDNKTKAKHWPQPSNPSSLSTILDLYPLSLRPSSRHSAGRSSALMTRRILTHRIHPCPREAKGETRKTKETQVPPLHHHGEVTLRLRFLFASNPTARASNPTKWQCQEIIKKKINKCHVAMSCRQMSLESVGLASLSRLPLRAHQRSPLAAEYAPLEALEPIAPHSDPRTDNARSPRL